MRSPFQADGGEAGMGRRTRAIARFGQQFVLAACVVCTACDGDSGLERGTAEPVGAGDGLDRAAGDGGPWEGGAEGFAPPEQPPMDAPSPRRIVALETHAPVEVRAGQTFLPECLAVDDLGEAALLPRDQFQVRFSPDAAALAGPDGSVLAQKATALQVWCQSSALALIDQRPATVRVVPGEPALAETLLDTYALQAGDTLGVLCRAYDAYLNPVDVTPGLRVLPSDGGQPADQGFTFTRTGVYEVGCEVAGAEPHVVAIEVRAGAPVALKVARVPEQEVYALGAIVQIAARAVDVYDNPVPSARVALRSEPSAGAVGESRLRFEREGTFTVIATLVDDPTISDRTQVTVNGLGPNIVCGVGNGGLRDGAMVRIPASKQLVFDGSVSDANGVRSVKINGTPVSVGANGRLSLSLPVRFGMNFVDIVAVDRFGAESTRVCSFLASTQFHPPQDLLAGAVTLALGQAALDDNDPKGEIDSLNDLLHTALNSRALRDALHNELLNANPVKPRSCDQKVLGVCVFRTEINYLDSELRGPNSTQLTLIPNGIHARVVLNDVRLKLRVDGTLSSTGWAKFARITVDVDFDARLVSGRPSIQVRRESVNVAVDGIDTDFGGVSGFFLDIVLSIAKGTLRDAVRNLVSSWVRDNFNQILDGVIGGLDISSLGSRFSVPSLDGSKKIEVAFGLGFSSLDVTAQRMRFGIGTRFSSTTALGVASLGVAIPDGGTLRERDGTTPAELSVQVAVFNQALHALWRAGLFEGNLAGALGAGKAVDGLQIVVSAQLPPVAHLRTDGMTELGLGALRLSLVYPGIWDDPIVLSLGARATMQAQLSGEDLRFSNLVVQELVFSSESTPLDSESREVLTDVLLSLVQSLVARALNDAIPALPIPSFTLPSSLTAFGLPAGARLGLKDRVLVTRPPHFVLRSGFGIGARP